MKGTKRNPLMEAIEEFKQGNEIIGEDLTIKQERFCRNYSQNEEFFGNATLSYAEAYGFDLDAADRTNAIYSEEDEHGKRELLRPSDYTRMYDNCSAYGSRLIRNDKIQERNRVLFNEMMRDDVIDARMFRIIMQGKDVDAISAIKEYNKLKARITEKVDHTTKGNPIGMGYDILAQIKSGKITKEEAYEAMQKAKGE